jgi:hypothetical protein
MEFNCPRRRFKKGFGVGILEALSVTECQPAQNLNIYCKEMNNE